MRKFGTFLFDTWYGAAAACAVSAAGLVAGTLFSFLKAGQVVAGVFLVLLLLSGLALAAAFARSLWKRAWGRAAAQLALGLVGVVGVLCTCVVAVFSSLALAYKMGWKAHWVGAEEQNGVVPFEVEYRRAPSLGAEYDRRVAFASGKRVGIAMDTGGYAPLSVYALEGGTHALADEAGNLFRVDAAAETVDMEVGRRWFRLPDGTEEVSGWGTGGVDVVLENGEKQSVRDGVPVGEGLDGRRLVGKFVPYGRFVEAEDGDDWLAEAPWGPLPGWPEELPFAMEWRKERGRWGDGEWRVAFASGKTVPMPLRGMSATLHEMADGNYALQKADGSGFPHFRHTYRIRPGDERLDELVNGAWVEWPEGLRERKGSGWTHDGAKRWVDGLDENGNTVKGTNSVSVGATLEGMRPVGRLAENGTFAKSPDPEAAGTEAEKKAE